MTTFFVICLVLYFLGLPILKALFKNKVKVQFDAPSENPAAPSPFNVFSEDFPDEEDSYTGTRTSPEFNDIFRTSPESHGFFGEATAETMHTQSSVKNDPEKTVPEMTEEERQSFDLRQAIIYQTILEKKYI